jgi:hypothetical protein
MVKPQKPHTHKSHRSYRIHKSHKTRLENKKKIPRKIALLQKIKNPSFETGT